MSGVRAQPQPLGGFTACARPAFGIRPTLRFTLAVTLTGAWIAFSVWVSGAWRSDLEDAIGPIAAWAIPILLAYIPGVVIGFMCFTLLLTRYRPPPFEGLAGPWPAGEWPAVTVIVAAYNEEDAIELTLEHIACRPIPAPSRSCWPTTTRPTAPPRWPKRLQTGARSSTGAASSRWPASTTRSIRRSPRSGRRSW